MPGHALLRTGVVLGALAYGGLAIGNGLDRLAMVRPAIAGMVPALFATDALEVQSEATLLSHPAASGAMAARLVARAPIEPFSTALLGGARAAAGDDGGAYRAFVVAGQLGWRVPLTQSYWLYAALQSGDMRVAALRLDALLRQRPQLLLRNPAILAPFEADVAGQDALLARLATRPPWLAFYTGESDPVSADVIARRLPTLLRLGDRGIILGCAAIAPACRMLTMAGMTEQALQLQRRHCPGAATP